MLLVSLVLWSTLTQVERREKEKISKETSECVTIDAKRN